MPRRPPLTHDLLRLQRLPHWHAAPDWVAATLVRLPVVVARRAGAPEGWVSVGVRGERRNERFGAWVSIADIAALARPEMLVDACAPLLAPVPREYDVQRHAALPAFVALRQLAAVLRPFRLAWGPTGSVGFELASGAPVVHAQSDLDLMLRTPHRLSRGSAQNLLQALAVHAAGAGVRIDAQLETPGGAIALAEYAGGAKSVLLRTGGEPLLVEDPWASRQPSMNAHGAHGMHGVHAA
jgi:phosphoribosyl-dephospho-CoA transferase